MSVHASEPATSVPVLPAPAGPVSGLYVHVPFCFHKCHYCDFYSITRQSPARMAAFVDRVLAEARLWAARSADAATGVETVFFGGGTPSLLPVGEMLRLISGLREVLGLSRVREWTVECNPATVDREYLARMREAGVDRVSFGAQSFDRRDLAVLERHHDPEDVPRSVEAARQAGLTRINLDLIFGTPGQTRETWDQSLREAIALGTDHLSAYLLTYEPNTPIAVKKRLGLLQAAPEALELDLLRHTRAVLSGAGLTPYEISNYTRGGQECRHNLMYWRGGSYLGLGPSAASHVHGDRWRNKPHLGEWEASVDRGELPVIEFERLPPARREAELAYLMVRTTRGVEFAEFASQTGGVDARSRFARAIERLVYAGVVEVDATGLRLTDSGIAVADAVGAELLSEQA